MINFRDAEFLTFKGKYQKAYTILTHRGKMDNTYHTETDFSLFKLWNAIKLKKYEEARNIASVFKEDNEKTCGGYCSYRGSTYFILMQNDFTNDEREFLNSLNIP